MNIKLMFRKIKNWFTCNIFNIHYWGYSGTKDLYGNTYWQCIWCNRIKYKDYKKERAIIFRKQLYKEFNK